MMWLCGISFLLLTILNQVHARYRADATDNVVVYYGQNSWGQSHNNVKYQDDWQGRLEDHCNDTNIDVINIAFLIDMVNLELNLANLDGDKDLCPDGLKYCKNMEDDIKTCQENGKQIVLSIGGQYTHDLRTFKNSEEARKSAQKIWRVFGPRSADGGSEKRPFGNSTVDGFDLDIETPGIKYLPEWAEEMRRLTKDHKILLTASPECSHNFTGTEGPMTELLKSNVTFDYMNVQFYNNKDCWVQDTAEIQSPFLQQWSSWADRAKSQWLVGLAAGQHACNSIDCYKDDMSLFDKPKSYSGFTGMMAWDASHLKDNKGFLSKAKNALKTSVTSTVTFPSSTSVAVTTSTTSS